MALGNRQRRALAGLAAVALSIAAAGCGSDDGAPSEEAALKSAVAERLALRSEAVAASLDSGDTCGAAQAADDLAREVSAAEMPEELRAEAAGAAAELVNGVNCEPEPTEEDDKKKEKEDKEKDKDEEDDDEGSSGPGPPGNEVEQPPGREKRGNAGGFD